MLSWRTVDLEPAQFVADYFEETVLGEPRSDKACHC